MTFIMLHCISLWRGLAKTSLCTGRELSQGQKLQSTCTPFYAALKLHNAHQLESYHERNGSRNSLFSPHKGPSSFLPARRGSLALQQKKEKTQIYIRKIVCNRKYTNRNPFPALKPITQAVRHQFTYPDPSRAKCLLLPHSATDS